MLTQEQQIIEQIKKSDNVLITFNRIWNGDAIASALAMYLFLKKLEKKATIAADKFDQGKLYSFLPAYNSIQHTLENIRKFIVTLNLKDAEVDKVKYEIKDNALNFIITPKSGIFTHDHISSDSRGFTYDLITALDTPDLEALGNIYESDTEFFYHTPIINIDHHSDNEAFGQINQVELTAISTSEILFNLLTNYSRDIIDEDIATCLLAGIISKTRSFKTQNLTPQALGVASQLVSMGARREEIVNYLYRSRPLNVLKLWGRVLARLTSNMDNKLVWSVLAGSDFLKTETTNEDLEEVIDELIINIPDAHVIVLIYEKKDIINNQKTSATKALVHSTKNTNSLHLTRALNPSGTKTLARIDLPQEIHTAEKNIIENIKAEMAKLPI